MTWEESIKQVIFHDCSRIAVLEGSHRVTLLTHLWLWFHALLEESQKDFVISWLNAEFLKEAQ